MEIKSLKESYKEWWEKCGSDSAPDQAKYELRKAFYFGFMKSINMFQQLSNSQSSENEKTQHVGSVVAEFVELLEEIKINADAQEKPKYLIFDARYRHDPDRAYCMDTADTLEEAKEAAEDQGDCVIVETETMEIVDVS